MEADNILGTAGKLDGQDRPSSKVLEPDDGLPSEDHSQATASFRDVTEAFVEAAKDMDPEELVFTEGFTLLDAMSAFEIGEPRMDSGMILEHQRKPPFDPLKPLLPGEVCWILERSFACEMEWHAGNSLPQTVYTLLYVHYLGDMSPDFMPLRSDIMQDPLRPVELITVVLRAGMFGLLKCCDLSWRELSKGRVHDIEDWQGEKCDVSLLEGVSTDFVLKTLDDACDWLRGSSLSPFVVNQLCDILRFRKVLLQMYRCSPPLSAGDLRAFTISAWMVLRRLQVYPPYRPAPDSPASLAFDPYIARRLPNFMPNRVAELPPQGQTWTALGRLIDGWKELANLLESPCITTWEIAGCLRIWSPTKQTHVAYLRSLIQSTVFDRNTVLGQFSPTWLVFRFFTETLGISYESVAERLKLSEAHHVAAIMKESEREIVKLMVAEIRSQAHNPPRRRRYLMKSTLQWHELHDKFLHMAAYCDPSDSDVNMLLESLLRAASYWRLNAAREVILSGFQQDLYALEEMPIAYWYLARILDAHLECIDDILSYNPKYSEAHDELLYQSRFLTALQLMSIVISALMYNQSTVLPMKRLSLNFMRRYKWALKPEYDYLTPAHPLPDFLSYPSQLAKDILCGLETSRSQGYGGIWSAERNSFLGELANVCDELREVSPTKMDELYEFKTAVFKWNQRSHPWFPDIVH
ncbi:Mak10-domain-containing protein [Laetiporus sulphureus 93-53]|uniref:Mak10-domain-containing protein n=1 Tax=Laetiporus sulphureus 93-53 TaxID=1314785 RepID=A0A165H2G0_9APHY|nr:Mak10-domain-containing protein [Laetiporus sulphureus 93-53]KZT11152.1 Mak10-domain-containing protein [Laetiporus sulphureus 93-53]